MPRASDWSLTGNPDLDKILGGRGLPRGTGLTIKGPSRSGKTALAMALQFASIKRNEACLFVSYNLPWYKVIERFEHFGFNIRRYLKRGNLKILDNVSQMHHSPTSSSADLPEALQHAIAFCDPRDQEQYFKYQYSLVEDLLKASKGPGINIIDSADQRFQLLRQETKLVDPQIQEYFQRFRLRVANDLRFIGLHICTPLPGQEAHNVLDAVEEGTIELRIGAEHDDEKDEPQRYFRVVGLPYADHSRQWHRFTLTTQGVVILP